jgi:hypothetical protein
MEHHNSQPTTNGKGVWRLKDGAFVVLVLGLKPFAYAADSYALNCTSSLGGMTDDESTWLPCSSLPATTWPHPPCVGITQNGSVAPLLRQI